MLPTEKASPDQQEEADLIEGRKHRVVIEITFDRKVTAKQAKMAVNELVHQGLKRRSLTLEVVKVVCKEFGRVFAAETVKMRQQPRK